MRLKRTGDSWVDVGYEYIRNVHSVLPESTFERKWTYPSLDTFDMRSVSGFIQEQIVRAPVVGCDHGNVEDGFGMETYPVDPSKCNAPPVFTRYADARGMRKNTDSPVPMRAPMMNFFFMVNDNCTLWCSWPPSPRLRA